MKRRTNLKSQMWLSTHSVRPPICIGSSNYKFKKPSTQATINSSNHQLKQLRQPPTTNDQPPTNQPIEIPPEQNRITRFSKARQQKLTSSAELITYFNAARAMGTLQNCQF